MKPPKTTAHFIGGPWDGRTEEIHGLPPYYNVLAPRMPTAVFTQEAPAPDPEDFNRGRVIYKPREVWTWDGVRHARYVEAK